MHASLDNGHSKLIVSFVTKDNIAASIVSTSSDKMDNRCHVNAIKSFQSEKVICMFAESIVAAKSAWQ